MTIDIFEYERKKAIQTLVSLGAAQYIKDMELYHGRAGDGTNWEVDPNFNNSGNNTGNRNVYHVSGLYAGEYDIAKSFADARVKRGTGLTTEVHKIVSNTPDAIIFNLGFDVNELSDEDRKKYYSALRTLCSFGLTQDNPIKFEYREAYPIITKKCREAQLQFQTTELSQNHIQYIFESLKTDDRIRHIFEGPTQLNNVLMDIVGAYNSKQLLKKAPDLILDHYISGESAYIERKESYPLSSSYISAWCANNDIVGINQTVYSATLNNEISSNILFDTKKIMSERQYGEMLQHTINTYGEITNTLINAVDQDTHNFLINASSKEVMEYINKSPNCKSLLDKSAGIWEGWTVGQHTEAVLDFFDRFYSEDIPDELKPFIKIAILSHDIGKGLVREQKITQNTANLANSKHIYNALNIPNEFRSLIDFIISSSQDITTAILKGTGDRKELKEHLKNSCAGAYYKAFGKHPNEHEINALAKICITLQTCDSGAYTRYAQIREGNKMVSGGNDGFTQSFVINERGNPRIKVFEDEGM